MKRIKFFIILIYVGGIILMSGLTIFFVVKNVRQGLSLYFQDKNLPDTQLPFQEGNLDKLIENLKQYKFIE
jgi:hypothetical protein